MGAATHSESHSSGREVDVVSDIRHVRGNELLWEEVQYGKYDRRLA